MRLFFLILFCLFCCPFLLFSQTETAAEIYGAGVRAFYAGDYQTAISRYSEAIALKPNTVGYLYSRGLTYQKLYKDSLATIDFHRVVTLDPKYIDAWMQLGMVQIDEKHYDSARRFFDQVQHISPNDLPSLHQIGLIFYYKRKYFDAIDVFTKIIKLSPDDEQAYFKRGLARFSDEDFEGAASDFSESYRLNPENTLALEQRAMSYLRNNLLESACEDWNVLLKKGNPRVKDNIDLYCKNK